MVTIANGATLALTIKTAVGLTTLTEGFLVLEITKPSGDKIILNDTVNFIPTDAATTIAEGTFGYGITSAYTGIDGIWKVKVMSDGLGATTTIGTGTVLKTLGSFAYRVITLNTTVTVRVTSIPA